MTKDLPARRATFNRRPPFFCALLLLCCGLPLPGLSASATVAKSPAPSTSPSTAPTTAARPAAKADYRLAGVMAVGTDRIGFLEVPGGGQVLIRKGSVVDGGRVTVFDERELRIVFANRTVVLSLDEGVGTAGEAPTLGLVTDQSDDGHVMIREVDTKLAAESVGKSRAEAAGSRNAKKDASAELGQRFASLFNIPRDARVLAVNETAVTSADAAMKAVQTSLAEGNVVTLTLASGPDQAPGRVYLKPKSMGAGGGSAP